MTPSLLRTVLIVCVVLGLGVIANVLGTDSQSDKGAGAERGRAPPPERAASPGAPPATSEAARLIDGVQRELRSRGYLGRNETGDNVVLTRAAILAFEFDHNLPLTAKPSEAVMKALIFTQTNAGYLQHIAPETDEARRLIEQVQRALAHLGYAKPVYSAQLDQQTREAIKAFERARGLQPSGRVSAPLIDSLGPAFRPDGATGATRTEPG
jgi:peptidoglycan hydrolase-like protein with peptidoglycan-binding domain